MGVGLGVDLVGLSFVFYCLFGFGKVFSFLGVSVLFFEMGGIGVVILGVVLVFVKLWDMLVRGSIGCWDGNEGVFIRFLCVVYFDFI